MYLLWMPLKVINSLLSKYVEDIYVDITLRQEKQTKNEALRKWLIWGSLLFWNNREI